MSRDVLEEESTPVLMIEERGSRFLGNITSVLSY